MFIIVALVALVVLALLLVSAGVWSARVTAKALGLRDFRWFDSGQPEDRMKRFLVRAVSSLSGLFVAILLSVLTQFVEGKPVQTLEIRVRDGQPAAAAGLLDGDRILAVGATRVSSGDEVRAAISAPGDVKQVEVERGGERKRFDVAPDRGRIGVEFVDRREAFSVGEALSGGLVAPFELWVRTARTLLGSTTTELAGPVGIVREADGRSGSLSGMFRLLAILASLYWPVLAGVHAYAALTRVLFERTYLDAARVGVADERVAKVFRLHQALVLSLACLALAIVAHLSMDLAGFDWAGIVLLLLVPATASVYPLVWSLDQVLAVRPSYVRSALLVLPCVAPFAAIATVGASRKRLRDAGFNRGLIVPKRADI